MDDALSLNPDMAVIMGRPTEIAARGLQAIAADIPLLLEKPIGISAGAVDPLIEAAERAGAFVAVALPHTLGMMGLVRELDRAGRLGPISHTHFRLLNGPPRRYVDDGVAWVLDPAIGGGGALRNLGIHGVHAFLTLAGNQPVAVEHAALGRPIHGTAVEDYAAVALRAADGMIGVIEAGYTYASMTGGTFEWRVSARNATLTDGGDTIRIATLDDGAARDVPVRPPARRYDDSMSDMLKRLTAGQGPAVSLTDCRRAMDVIDRCYAAQGEER